MKGLPLVTALLALTLISCSKKNNDFSPPAGQAAATSVAQDYVDDLVRAAGGEPDDPAVGSDTLYRFGERLEAGDVIHTAFEQEPIEVIKPTWMFWHDPAPILRFDHTSTLILVDDATGEPETIEIRAWPVVNGGDRWGDSALVIPPEDVVFDRSGLYEELTEEDLTFAVEPRALTRRHGLNVDCEPRRHFLLIYGAPGTQANTMGAEARQITGLMNQDWMEVDRVTVAFTWRDFEGATTQEYVENFRNYLEEWFLGVDCCDEVILYYIGHGHDSGVGAWGLGRAEDGRPAAIRGQTLGFWLRDIIDFGHGCKFMLINHSCYSAAFNQELSGVIEGDVGSQAERGEMLLEHSSLGNQETVDNFAGNQLMNSLQATLTDGEGASWDALRNVVTNAMVGFEADDSDEVGLFTSVTKNNAGVLGVTGQEVERCCPGCGDDIVDEEEECDGEGTACDDGDPDTIGDVCDAECQCSGTPDPGSDEDGDGIDDEADNCSDLPNPGQEDCNNNGVGDVCDGGMASFGDQTGDWILPEMGGQPTSQGIPQLDIEGVTVDLQQTPGAVTVVVDLVQDAPPTTPGFSGIDVVFRVDDAGDQSPGLFNGGLVNLRLETEGQGQPYACKIYRFDEGAQTWQEEPLQNGMLPPGVACDTNGDLVTFVFDLAGIPAPVCELGLSVFTQERRDIDADNNPDLIADWLQPIIQRLPGY